MAFPTVDAATGTFADTTNQLSHAVPYPAVSGGIVGGDLLILFAVLDETAAGPGVINWPAGWTEILQTDAPSTQARVAVAYQYAQGGESGNVTLTTTLQERLVGLMLCIHGAAGVPPEVGTIATGTSTAPNPGATTPSYGAADTLWIAAAMNDFSLSGAASAGPASYSGLISQTGANGGAIAVAFRNLNAATDDPSTFTLSASEEWAAFTLAVKGATPVLAATAGPKDHVIRVQALGGTWETIGTDRARGIWPEGIVAEADAWGSSRLSFTLHRDPLTPWPDLGAFTPVDYECGGKLVWSGRVAETPSQPSEHVMNVQCEGWQFHLDDDVYENVYVTTDLTAFKDVRSLASADLTVMWAGLDTQVQAGSIVLTWPNGQTLPAAGKGAGAVLGLPQGSDGARTVSVDVDSSNNTGTPSLFVIGGDGPYWATGGNRQDWLSGRVNNTFTSSTFTATVASPHPWITLLLFTGTGGPSSADIWFRITGIRVATNPAYMSGSTSILKASTVITDAITKATMLLSTDRSGIQATTFNIPSYQTQGPQTPRQVIEAVNSFHAWVTQVDVNKRMIYKPQPAAASLEVGAWSAMTDEDQSQNSGEEIYNKAILTWTNGQGADGRLYRGASGKFLHAAVQPSNPSFDVDASGWDAPVGTVVRNTSIFDAISPPASLEVKYPNPGTQAQAHIATYAGTFKVGASYQLRMRLRRNAATDSNVAIFMVGTNGFTTSFTTTQLPTNTFTTVLSDVFQINVGDTVPPDIRIIFNSTTSQLGSVAGYVDAVEIVQAFPTLADSRGFFRTKVLPVNATLPDDLVAAKQIADTWLPDHVGTPFRGSLSVTGSRAVREVTTGQRVPPEVLLTKTMELIRFTDRANPDDGTWGRDGRVVGVQYSADTDTAQVTIDNSRQSFEALMNRFNLLTGSS